MVQICAIRRLRVKQGYSFVVVTSPSLPPSLPPSFSPSLLPSFLLSLPPSLLPSLPPSLPPSQDDLLCSAALLKEANAIGVELKKQVGFQFLILRDTPYSPVPFAVATGTDVDIDMGEAKFSLDNTESSFYRPEGPLVAVEVKDSKHGATHIWSLRKLK